MKKYENRDKTILVILILVIAALIFLFLFRAYNHYSAWRGNHTYFDRPDWKIESWMTLRTISTRFNITDSELFREVGVNEIKINPHITLDLFCKEYHQNCTDLVERLNVIAGK